METIEQAVLQHALAALSKSRGTAFTVERLIHPVAHPMHCGIDAVSAVLRDDTGGERFFFKVMLPEQALFCDFEATVEASTLAAGAGLAPGLVASDADQNALLYQALGNEWRFAMVSELRKAAVREAAIAAKKTWHGQRLLATTRTSFDRIQTLGKMLAQGVEDGITGERVRVPPPQAYAAMCDWVARIEQSLTAVGFDLAPCHVENSISNLMLGPAASVQMVDFDRAANGDPLADVGALCNNYCRTEDDIAEAAEIYHGQANRSILSRIKLYMVVEDFHWGLWGKVCHFLSARRDIEFYKFGENHFLRCLHRLYTWDVDALIRSL